MADPPSEPAEPSRSRRRSPAMLLASAQSSLNASDLDEAKALAEHAVALAEAVGDRLMHARAVTLLARILYVRSETAEAMGLVLAAIDLSRTVGDLTSTAKAHEVATRILLDVGETHVALSPDDPDLFVAALRGPGD